MKNSIVLLIGTLILAFQLNAQCYNYPCSVCPKVDSVKTNYFSNPPTMHVFGKFDYASGFWLNNVIAYSDTSNTVVIDFYWAKCSFGWIGTLEYYDQFITVDFNHVPQFDFRINHIIDTLPWIVDSSICVFNIWPDTCLMSTHFFPYGYNVSLSELTEESISVSPNPARDEVHVQTTEAKMIQQLVLQDITGKEVKRVVGNVSIMDVNELPSGTYFLLVETKHGVFRKKVILQ